LSDELEKQVGLRSLLTDLPKELRKITLWELMEYLAKEIHQVPTLSSLKTTFVNTIANKGVPAQVFQSFLTRLNIQSPLRAIPAQIWNGGF